MVAQVAEPQPSVSQQLDLRASEPDPKSESPLDSAKTLICALNFLSRNLPLPQHVYDAVSSIYQDSAADGGDGATAEVGSDVEGEVSDRAPSPLRVDNSSLPSYDELMLDFEDAVLNQRSSCLPGSRLSDLKETRFRSRIQHRLTELEELPTSRGEDLQSRCLLELYGLKLAELQSKVRSEVSAEYWLRLQCANPDKQLFDWGMMRLRRPLYGIGDAFAMEADDPLKKKREAERLSRFEEEERNRIETRKRKFFADLLNAARELQLQVQAAQKRRKQRNDGVQAWHGRLRQRATRAEKLRFQALKADDQEAYMKMVEESKNERLTMLLGKTNDLLVRLGAAVQREKDAAHDSIEPLEGSDTDLAELSGSRTDTPAQSLPEEDEEIDDEPDDKVKTGDLLEGQRK
ncbi:Nucleoplasmin ATPase [Handroanthus impetiginosus]|uniref:Nucleoplasmin ATPase n=1 Tax=Handroanthus impetiginosus TaxID=429701 RepID=A0A2G9HG68_9LAMI|nr:Nucleoplasmin ATPase [Handroanthus impetiginosus]